MLITKLIDRRQALNITQEEVARVIDISLRQYVNIEKNLLKTGPSILIALKLADMLKCEVTDLFKLEKD